MGVRGGTLLSGWRGTLLKEWTLATQVTAGSGLPLNPVDFCGRPGDWLYGNGTPDYTGAPLYTHGSSSFLNSDAYATPAPGTWGNAGVTASQGLCSFVWTRRWVARSAFEID